MNVDVSLKGSDTALSCKGCGYSTLEVLLFERHKKRCFFGKRLDAGLLPNENATQAGCAYGVVPLQRRQGEAGAENSHIKSLLKTTAPVSLPKLEQSTRGHYGSSQDQGIEMLHGTEEAVLQATSEGKKTGGGGERRKSSARRRTYLCGLCGYSTQLSRAYLEHLRHVHKRKVQIYQCDVCPYACQNRYKLLRHRNHVHQDRSPRSLNDFQNVSNESKSWQNAKTHSDGSSVVESPIVERKNIFEQVQNLLAEDSAPVVSDSNTVVADMNPIVSDMNPSLSDVNPKQAVLSSVIRDECMSQNDSTFDMEKTQSDVNANVLDLTVKTNHSSTNQMEPELPVLDLTSKCSVKEDQVECALPVSIGDTNPVESRKNSHPRTKPEQYINSKMEKPRASSTESTPKRGSPALVGANEQDNPYDGDAEVESITAAAELSQELPLFNFRNSHDHFKYRSRMENLCSPIKAMSNMEKYLDQAMKNVKQTAIFSSKATKNVAKTTRQNRNRMPENTPSSCEGRGELSGSSTERATCVESAYSYVKAVTLRTGEGQHYGCRLCRYGSSQKWKVAHHVRQIHLRTSFYKCFHCDFVCKRKTEWTVHLVKHSTRKVHCCPECSYKTVMRRNFVRHMVHHKVRKPAKCLYCSYSSTGEAAIQRHMSEFHPSAKQEEEHREAQMAYHRASKAAAVRGMDTQRQLVGSPPIATSPNAELVPFQSPEVPRNPFVPRSPVSSRASSVHSDSGSSTGRRSTPTIYTCPECGASFKGRSNLRSHMVTHSDETPWLCPFCDLRYKRKADLGAHMKNKHNSPLPADIKPEPGSAQAVLFEDGVEIDVKPNLQDQPLNLSVKPIAKTESDGSYESYTQREFRDISQKPEVKEDEPLDLSKKEHVSLQGQTLYRPDTLKCSHCSYIAKWPGDLRRHKLIHSIERRFQCGICGKKFKYQFDLKTHFKQVHKQPIPKPRSTRFPPRIFPGRLSDAQARSLAAVSRQSTDNQQKLRCSQCDYVGKYRAELERHMSVHTGQKPWACLFCEYMSHWKGDMKRHLEKHHTQAISIYGDVHHLLSQSYCMVRDDSDDNSRVDTSKFSGDSSACGTDSDGRTSASPSPHKSSAAAEPEVKRRILPDGTHKTTYKCPQCPYENEAPSKVKTHMEIHGNLKRFMCPVCGKRSNWVWDVRKHIGRAHEGSSMDVIQLDVKEARDTLGQYLSQCHEQNADATSRKRIEPESYVVLKADIPEPSITRCTPPRRRAPVKPGTPSPSAKLRPFKCSECGRRSNWRWDLNKHIRSRHPHAELITLSEEEARKTIHEVADRQPRFTKLEPKQEDYSSYKSDHKSPPRLLPSKLSPPPANVRVSPPFLAPSHGTPFPVAQPLAQRYLSRTNSIQKRPGRRAFPDYVKKLVAGKFRPFKCSLCGKRSNWKWDVSKHIRIQHPGQTGHVITLTEEEAKSTYHEVEIARLRLKLCKEEQTIDKLEKKSRGLELGDIHPDLKIIKRFQCSVCLYRSNFKADVTKHVAKQHAHVDDAYVNVLDPDVARETLTDYELTHGSGLRRSKKTTDFGNPLSGVDLAKALSRASEQQRAMTNGSTTEQDDTLNTSGELSDRSSPRPPSVCSSSGGGKRDIYLCKKCSFYTTSQKAIITHYRSHAEQGIYRCTICNERSDYKHSIVRHVQKRHGLEAYSEADKHIVQREIYTIIHGDPAELSQMTGGESAMDVSHDESHSQGFVVTMYKCTICGPIRSSDLRYSVVRHVRRVHPNVANPEDYVDEFETMKPALSPAKIYNGNTSDDKESPVNESPLKVKDEDGSDAAQHAIYMTKKHKCNICPFRTNKPAHLRMHLANHQPQPGNKLRCSYCEYYVAQAHHMRAHERIHVKENLFGSRAAENKTGDGVLSKSASPAKQSSALPKYACDRCPFMSRKKNEFLYHKQFHRPKQSAQHKCELCPYWCKDARALKLHMQVHDTDYLEAVHKVAREEYMGMDNSLLMASPCKSDISDTSVDDIIQSAELKQRIIASKVKSVAVTPHKVNTEPPHFIASPDVMQSYVLNPHKQSLSSGMYRKFYKCKYCPWTNVRHQNLVLHEKMHGQRSGKEMFKCQFCNYHVGNRTLLSHHVKVHSEQYTPGVDIVDDVEGEGIGRKEKGEEEKEDRDVQSSLQGEKAGNGDDAMDTEEEEGILIGLDKEETEHRIVHHRNSTRMDMLSFPNKSNYYIKYSEGKHILEKAVLKKWCCEKCPYATMKKSQFEKHVSLHGSRQKYVCQYCDYSVPGYHLLLQHEKLHRMPNPNLLSVQSIANLTQLPEIPADVAAATQYASEGSDLGIHDHIKSLYEHTPAFTEPKKLYHCDRCPYSNARRDHILAHLKFHMIRSDYKCKYCDYSVTKSHLLNQHVKVHFILPGSAMSSESPPEKPEADSADNLPIPLTKEEASKPKKEVGDSKKVTDPKGEDMRVEDENLNSKKSLNDSDAYVDDVKTLHGEKPVSNTGGSKSVNNNKSEENSPVCDKKAVSKSPPNEPGVINPEEDKEEEKGKKSGEGPDTVWVCQYCDRVFHSSPKLLQHERQHLIGSKELVV